MRASLTSMTIGVLVLGCTAPAIAAGPVNPQCTPRPGVAVRGDAAATALGDRLPAAARAAGMSTQAFTEELRRDRTLWVDSCAQPY